MLKPRIIPCLLVQNGGLVKTVAFGSPTYVGDPINTVRLFNEKEVDELIVVDIDATAHNSEPNYDLIKKLAAECRMPLCYGGGVKTIDQVDEIVGIGVEKVALSSAAVQDPTLVAEIARSVGSQSVVVVLDAKRDPFERGYEVWTHNGTRATGRSPGELAAEMEAFGAGEIVINSIDNDGAMTGYDIQLAKSVRDSITVPMTVLGGAGSLEDLSELVSTFGIVGAAAGSLFVFKGRYRAVLINYPGRRQKDAIVAGMPGASA